MKASGAEFEDTNRRTTSPLCRSIILRFTGRLDKIMSDSNQTFDLTTAEGRKNVLALTKILFPIEY
jgi:hypothetical protein